MVFQPHNLRKRHAATLWHTHKLVNHMLPRVLQTGKENGPGSSWTIKRLCHDFEVDLAPKF